jgi:predicted nucleic acid-binding protein
VTAVKVVDASALGAALYMEPAADLIGSELRGATLVAPHLLGYELASICQKKIRAAPDRREAILAQFGAWTRIEIELLDVDYAELVQLAERSGLTTYDASYLWLARRLGAELVTLDRRLARAADPA